MRKASAMLWMATLTVTYTVTLMARETREQAIAGMRQVEANEMDSSYTTAAPFAQKLVDQALAEHPEVLLLAIHAQPPEHKNVIVASNFGRIGKIGDEDDMRCIRTGKSNLEVSPTGKHFEDQLVLLDQTGKTIGAIGVVFNYKPGDDKQKMVKIATGIRDEMRKQLPTEAALFE